MIHCALHYRRHLTKYSFAKGSKVDALSFLPCPRFCATWFDVAFVSATRAQRARPRKPLQGPDHRRCGEFDPNDFNHTFLSAGDVRFGKKDKDFPVCSVVSWLLSRSPSRQCSCVVVQKKSYHQELSRKSRSFSFKVLRRHELVASVFLSLCVAGFGELSSNDKQPESQAWRIRARMGGRRCASQASRAGQQSRAGQESQDRRFQGTSSVRLLHTAFSLCCLVQADIKEPSGASSKEEKKASSKATKPAAVCLVLICDRLRLTLLHFACVRIIFAEEAESGENSADPCRPACSFQAK